MRLDHLLSKELVFFAHSCGLVVWLSRRVCDCHVVCFCRVEACPQVCLHYFDGGVGGLVGVCAAWCVGLVDTPVLRDKSVVVLVHCWVSGAALVVPVGPYVHG